MSCRSLAFRGCSSPLSPPVTAFPPPPAAWIGPRAPRIKPHELASAEHRHRREKKNQPQTVYFGICIENIPVPAAEWEHSTSPPHWDGPYGDSLSSRRFPGALPALGAAGIQRGDTQSPFQGAVPAATSARRRQILSKHLLLIPTMSALIPWDPAPSRSRSRGSVDRRHKHGSMEWFGLEGIFKDLAQPSRLQAGKILDCRESPPGLPRSRGGDRGHPTLQAGTSTPSSFPKGFPSREQSQLEKTPGMRTWAWISRVRRARSSSHVFPALGKRALKLHSKAPQAARNSRAVPRKFLDPPCFPGPGCWNIASLPGADAMG